MARHITTLLVLLAAAGTAAAQDDADLARVLVQRGWFDLAEDVCKKIQTDSRAGAKERASVPLIQAEIRIGQAESEPDLDKSKKYLDEAVTVLSAFVKENPQHELANETRITMGWALARKARRVLDALEMEEDFTKHDALRDQASDVYGTTEKHYRETLDLLRKEKRTDAVLNAIMDARLELCRSMYERAKLGRGTDDERKKLLNDAVKMLVDFEFDYGDRPIGFEGTLLGGQCLVELGDKKAEQKLKMAMALQDSLADNKIRPNDYHKRVIWTAAVAVAKLLTATGRADQAKVHVDRMFKENRGLDKEWGGFALRLEKAEALAALGDSNGAIAITTDIIKASGSGRYAVMAQRAQRRYASSGGAAVSADQMMTSADSYLEREQWRDATVALRRCIEACVTDAEKQKFLLQAYYKLGQSHAAMRRNHEAAAAYTMVCRIDAKHDMAGKACSELARCYYAEFALSGDKRDEEAKKKALDHLGSVHKDHPAAINIPYMQAEELESRDEYKAAAERFLSVNEKAEAYESALVRGAYCYRASARVKWGQGTKDPKLQAEAKEELRQAEAALRKFLAYAEKPENAPKDQAATRARGNLVFLANEELVRIFMHESINRTADCLVMLVRNAKELPPDDERLGRNWQLQIQCLLDLNRVDEAVTLLEEMFAKFPDGLAIAQACKSVGIRVDNATTALMKAQGDPELIAANLKRVSKYYRKWIDEGVARGMRVTIQDVSAVADALYVIAKQLNGLDETVTSFMDLKGRKIAAREYFDDAALVLTMLVDERIQKLPPAQRIALMTRLARCYSFLARDGQDWAKSKEQYENIIKFFKLVDDKNNTINTEVLMAHRELLGVYLELGYVLYEMGRGGERFQFDNASSVFANVVRVTQSGSEPWWIGKYMVLAILFERGRDSDVKQAQLGVKNLQDNYPDLDGGKFGMKAKLEELRAKIERVVGGGR